MASLTSIYTSDYQTDTAAARIEDHRCTGLDGSYGFTKEYPVERFYRDSKIGTIYEGSSIPVHA